MHDTLWGMGPNGWLATATAVYAVATLLLAGVTVWSSRKAIEASRRIATEQNATAREGTAGQIDAATRSVSDQIDAAANNQRLQLASVREAAIIQARASSVSNNRQAWINSLRDEVTGFLTDAEMADVVRNEMPVSEARTNEQFRSARALIAHIFKVRLLINPTEGESTRLVEMLEEAKSEGLTDERREAIVQHSQAILKREWERVKSGE